MDVPPERITLAQDKNFLNAVNLDESLPTVRCSWAPEHGDDTMLMNAWWGRIRVLKCQATWTNLLKSDLIGLDEMEASASSD
eukprot:7230194-Karenia_brevis.AAC.1